MSAAQTTIRWAAGERDLRAALALREEVFCGEQGVSLEEEHDGLDGQALHLVALAPGEGRVVGTLRVLEADGTAKIGRVAVQRAWRRRGVALEMLTIALQRAGERGCVRARLAAQIDAVELYRRAGFAVESDRFLEAGIEHVWMGRTLDRGRSGGRRRVSL